MTTEPRAIAMGAVLLAAQLVEFVHDDYQSEPETPDPCVWSAAYVVACFLAQHTPRGAAGVDTETALIGLQINRRMPFAARLALAEQLVREHQRGTRD